MSGDNPYKAKFVSPQAKTAGFAQQGDATGGLIPYKNVPALVGYYLGFLALLPCLGLPFSIPAIVLGILGLRKKAREPAVKGSAHAMIGIIFGSISLVLNGIGWIMVIFAMFSEV